MRNIYNTPQVVQSILQIFSERKISATWAVVGLLFATSRRMIEEFSPDVKPEYEYPEYNPYQLSIGENEIEDPLHYAASLIKKIQLVPEQEIATHTFSHIISRENGVTLEAFLADLESAIKISEVSGTRIRSIVFPKNRLIKEFIDVLPQVGINVYRGAEKGWMYNKVCSLHDKKPLRISELLKRFWRLLDTYVPITGSNTWGIEELLVEPGEAVNVPASRFLRPYNPALKYLEWVKYRRIRNQIEYAARNGRMVHLRWHPHNFGSNIDRNIMLLHKVLDCYEKCRQKYNMKSMTMSSFADSIPNTACDCLLQPHSCNK